MTRHSHTHRALFALIATFAVVAVPATSAPARTTAPVDEQAVEGYRLHGHAFVRADTLKRHVEARGFNWERFLRRSPAVVQSFELRPVRVAGRTFFAGTSVKRWLRANKRSYTSWRRSHPHSVAVLVANRYAAYRSAAATGNRKNGVSATPVAPQLGISAGGSMPWRSDADLARELDDYSALGARWVRVDVAWSTIERTRGSYDWTAQDRVIDAAHARGIQVLAIVTYTPDWARVAPGLDDKHAPANVQFYADFAAKVVERYAPRGVKAYEIWNEPNLEAFWKPAPSAERYTELLRAAYRQMKRADSSITVLAGALAARGGYNDPNCDGGSDTRESPNQNPVNFLERMYAAGAQGSFDALSHHPYDTAGPSGTHLCNGWHQMTSTRPSIRSLMEGAGDGGKQIWATEYGNDAERVPEAVQASRVDEAWRLWRSQPWAGPMFYYTYRELVCCLGFNLVRADWSKTSAWFAYQQAARS
jgi:hypothetical protein